MLAAAGSARKVGRSVVGMLRLAELLRTRWVHGYRRIPWPTFAGALAFLIALTAWVLAPDSFRNMPRERLFDRILPSLLHSGPAPADIVIVDIDRSTLSAVGAWPWPRAQLAHLVEAAASGRPSVIALDLFLGGRDRWAPDGDKQLADALAAAPSVLGFRAGNQKTGRQSADHTRPVAAAGIPARTMASARHRRARSTTRGRRRWLWRACHGGGYRRTDPSRASARGGRWRRASRPCG